MSSTADDLPDDPTDDLTRDAASPSSRALRLSFVALVAILIATTISYLPVRAFGFVDYDDPVYVRDNPAVAAGLSAEGLRWAFTAYHASNWHPLTWLSHMADVSWFGMDPGAHHVVNLVLHLINAVLLWFALVRFRQSALVAAVVTALFALHPLRVESVAWIAERKDVLSATFFLLGLSAWTLERRLARVCWTGLCFALGLLAKPMLVSMPLVLLLLDRWPLKRPLRESLRLVFPLTVLAAASCFVTLRAQGAGGAISSLERLPLDTRLAHAPVAFFGYLRRLAWPADLACYYPHPALESSAPQSAWTALALGALAGCLLLAVVCWGTRRTRPWLLVGLGWTVVMLAPVIGIVQVGGQSLADRYTYLPLLGVTWAVVVLAEKGLGTRALTALGLGASLALALATHRAVEPWRDTVSLFRQALAVTGENPVVETNLGTALAERGAYEEAEPHLRRAIELRPQDPRPRTSLGSLLLQAGRPDEARTCYLAALQRVPDFGQALRGLGAANAAMGDAAGAILAFRRSLAVSPRDAQVHFELARLLEQAGSRDEALAQYLATLEDAPQQLGAALSYAWLVARTPSSRQELARAVAFAQAVVGATGETDANAFDVLAGALAASGDFQAAVRMQERALALGPATERPEREARLVRYRAQQTLVVPGAAGSTGTSDGAPSTSPSSDAEGSRR